MSELDKKPDVINSKEDFVEFLNLLIQDLKNNPAEWSNKTLEDYLDALLGWTEDMEGYYKNSKLPLPPKIEWRVFANMLMAATVYE